MTTKTYLATAKICTSKVAVAQQKAVSRCNVSVKGTTSAPSMNPYSDVPLVAVVISF